MIKKVKYNKIVNSCAMSKHPSQNGLVIEKVNGVLTLYGTNARTNDITSHLYLQIPIDNVGEVIEALNTFNCEKSN